MFLTQRDDYEPHYVDNRKYFELDTFYSEFAKDWTERRLPMEYQPREGAIDVYRYRQERNTEWRHVASEPAGFSGTVR